MSSPAAEGSPGLIGPSPDQLTSDSPLGFSPSALRADVFRRRRSKEESAMAKTVTPDQVLRAARELKQSEFTRDDLAAELGVGKPKFKTAFKAARESGDVEKVRDGDDRKGRFRVTDE